MGIGARGALYGQGATKYSYRLTSPPRTIPLYFYLLGWLAEHDNQGQVAEYDTIREI